MSALTELDTSYIKSINALHSKDHLLGNKPSLQAFLEEAIKHKAGKDVNLTAMVQTLMKQSGVETLKISMDDDKLVSTSDNELELDLLLKEDLACVICQGMDVGARNRLLECTDCHSLYHQECHQPPVSQQDADVAWLCATCKEAKKAKKSPPHVVSSSSSSTHSSSHSSTHVSSKPKSSSNSPRHSGEKSDRSERSDRGSSSGYKSSSSSSSKSGSKSSSSSGSGSKSSSSSSKSSSSKHTSVISSSSIVSADKRLQNMKKKAAKLHEKKKLPR